MSPLVLRALIKMLTYKCEILLFMWLQSMCKMLMIRFKSHMNNLSKKLKVFFLICEIIREQQQMFAIQCNSYLKLRPNINQKLIQLLFSY